MANLGCLLMRFRLDKGFIRVELLYLARVGGSVSGYSGVNILRFENIKKRELVTSVFDYD